MSFRFLLTFDNRLVSFDLLSFYFLLNSYEYFFYYYYALLFIFIFYSALARSGPSFNDGENRLELSEAQWAWSVERASTFSLDDDTTMMMMMMCLDDDERKENRRRRVDFKSPRTTR